MAADDLLVAQRIPEARPPAGLAVLQIDERAEEGDDQAEQDRKSPD
jgi:hypothetical protein